MLIVKYLVTVNLNSSFYFKQKFFFKVLLKAILNLQNWSSWGSSGPLQSGEMSFNANRKHLNFKTADVHFKTVINTNFVIKMGEFVPIL